MTDLTYTLKRESIACEPHELRMGRRDLGRMLVVDRAQKSCVHSMVLSLPDFFEPGDVFVINDSKRIPGVVWARTETENAQVELRFTHIESERVGVCRVYPRHNIRAGARLCFGEGSSAIVRDVGLTKHELCRIECETRSIPELMKELGAPITSFFYQGYWSIESYNNFYARDEGSFESPMAGLHLTPELIERISARGAEVHTLTLHVVGSWLPPTDPNEKIAAEPFSIPVKTAAAVSKAKNGGNRVFACGSTTVKALETAANEDGIIIAPMTSESALFISPGFHFRVVDGYFTNFHPSSSSLMLLDSAFCDPSLLMESYREASAAGYLFFEFGDAVLYI